MSTKLSNVTLLSEDGVVPYLMDAIEGIANDAINSRGTFLLGVSGGSIINFLSGDDGLPTLQTDWKCWKIFLCDERIVDESDPESTGGMYKKLLLSKLPGFPGENFLAVNVSLPTAHDIAEDYERRLRDFWSGQDPSSASFGMTDCLLLGVGPDGHTCSLFPNHPALEATASWVTFVEDSPKPPPKRITLTYRFINKATHILIVGMGDQKLEIAERVQGGEDLPIGRVKNPGGHLEWIIGSSKIA